MKKAKLPVSTVQSVLPSIVGVPLNRGPHAGSSTGNRRRRGFLVGGFLRRYLTWFARNR